MRNGLCGLSKEPPKAMQQHYQKNQKKGNSLFRGQRDFITFKGCASNLSGCITMPKEKERFHTAAKGK